MQSVQQWASAGDYDRVFERRHQRAAFFALDRRGDDDVGALTASIAYVSRKDAERHLQILRRSLRRCHIRRPLVLEAGCGGGGYARWLASNLPATAVGFDASPAALVATQSTHGDYRAIFFVGDVRAIPLRNGCAGAALALDLLHLVADRAKTLIALRDALAPGASLLFTVVHADPAAGNTPASWRTDLEGIGYSVIAIRDLSTQWQEHMLAKHAQRWSKRQRLRNCLGAWIEPELQVSAAMLGLHGARSVIRTTRRHEFEVVRAA
jgi:SAM-dependent methyltransferase